MLVTRFIPVIIETIDDNDLTVNEILTGSAAAIFNFYKSTYDKDAEYLDFLHELKILADEHIRLHKEGEQK